MKSRETLGVGLAVTAAVALGADASYNTEPTFVDPAVTFDVPEGRVDYGNMSPDKAQRALATGISCDLNSITGIYNYPPLADSAFNYPHTTLEVDASLHFTPEAAAAFEQYEDNDRVIWDGGMGVEVFTPPAKDKAMVDLGSSVLTVSGRIQRPDMGAIMPTRALESTLKGDTVLVPYRTISLETKNGTTVSKIPCGQLIEKSPTKTQALALKDHREPVRTEDFASEYSVKGKDYLYNRTYYPTK